MRDGWKPALVWTYAAAGWSGGGDPVFCRLPLTPISRLSGEDMTLDSRPVSLDALSAEDGSAVALAVSQAASANTRRAYRQQWAAFTTWASAQGYPYLPAADATLAAYLTLLAGQDLALASVRQARGAVVKAHQLAGFPTPAGPVTAAALRGIGRSIGAGQRQAAPLTAEGLAAIRATAHLPRRGRGGSLERAAFARRRGLVDVALASVIRDSLLRVSETVALAWADVAPCTGRLRRCHRPALQDRPGIPGPGGVPGPSGNDGPGRNPARRRGRGRAHLRPVGPSVAAADSGNGPGRRFGRGVQRTQRPGGNGPGPGGQRRGAARADGRRSVAVAPDPGAVHGKASPGPGCGRQVLPGEGRQLAAAERVTIEAVLHFPSIGGLWPCLAQGPLSVGGERGRGHGPPHQQDSSGAGTTPATSSRIGAGPDGLTGR